jgi:hypothetical protein
VWSEASDPGRLGVYFAQRTPSWEEFNEFIGAKEATQLAEKYRIV